MISLGGDVGNVDDRVVQIPTSRGAAQTWANLPWS